MPTKTGRVLIFLAWSTCTTVLFPMSTRADTPENQPFYLPHSLNWPWCYWVVSFICLHDRARGTGRWCVSLLSLSPPQLNTSVGFSLLPNTLIGPTCERGKKRTLYKMGRHETQTFLVKYILSTYERLLWGFGSESVLIWWAGLNMLYRSDESCGPLQ